MKKFITGLLAFSLLLGTNALAKAAERDILDLSLNRDAAVSVKTNNNIMMSFGGHARIIPTSETDWDFGMADKAKGGYLGGALNSSFFKNHVNESGWINNEYIRTETRLTFNAVPEDEKWSFFAALEFDRPLDTASVDERGGKTDDHSDYGLERLHVTMALPLNMRLHAGWDIWGLDHGYAAGLVYADDNPGLWITGGDQKLNWNFGYFKLDESNFQTSFTTLKDTEDSDRTLMAGYITLNPSKEQKFQFFYGLDRIRNITSKDLYGALTKTGINAAPKTDSHHLGMYYNGTFGKIKLFGEAVYQLGEAKGANLTDYNGKLHKDYDINAYALSGDIALNLDFGIKLTPHAGFIYTSGDDNPNDGKLEGYNGINNVQRFSGIFGGEHTILADTNMVFGSTIYGFIPEMHGNGTPVYTGGQPAFGALGAGRGDNPGMLMTSLGISASPKPTLSFKSNINSFWWNEDIMVKNFVVPGSQKKVDSGYAGTEWDNLVTLVLSKHTFIQGQAAFLFPGEVIEDVTEALGAKADDTAMRLAAELIWKF
ncbi:MAG: alginate export family protein [Desulfobacteraceae bacterium]|nr:alginate export family protein [Desulfobacteraceae bacterium]